VNGDEANGNLASVLNHGNEANGNLASVLNSRKDRFLQGL
jgi:hypothetical protein